jgi:DNA repair exonuclease SbcCD ATPase subunit
MSGVYESLKVRVQDTLQRGKTPSIRLKSSSALNLQGEMEELERMIAARLGKIKAAVQQGEAEVADEAEQTHQVVESLKIRIAVLEAKLKEGEEALRKKDFARQQLEETLRADNQELQKELRGKDEVLASRDKQMNELKLSLDAKVARVSDLQSETDRAKEQAAGQAARATELAESFRAQLSVLESQLSETQDLSRQKDTIIEALEQKLSAKTQEFDGALKDKEKLLAWQRAEIADFKTQLQVLKKGIGEMSSFFRQAEVLHGIRPQDADGPLLNEPANGKHEKSIKAEADSAKVRVAPPLRAAEVVTPDIFQRIAGELAEVTGVISPLAALIVRQQVEALGESMEKFPRMRLAELLEKLARDIADEKQQSDFRQRWVETRKLA